MALRLGALLTPLIAVLLTAACIGGDGDSILTEEGSPLPTGTAPIFQRSPVSSPAASPTASPAAATPTASPTAGPSADVNVTPIAEAFEVTVTAENSGTRIRETPSTNGAILGAIYEGHRAKALGETRGQEAEPGQGDLWYLVELTSDGTTVRGFVYAPFVVKVQ